MEEVVGVVGEKNKRRERNEMKNGRVVVHSLQNEHYYLQHAPIGVN